MMNRLWFLAAIVSAMLFASLACGGGSAEQPEAGDAEQALAKEVEEDARRARRAGQKTETEQAPQQIAGEGEVVFPDEIVEETVRKRLKQDEGPILIADVEEFTEFSVALQLYVSNISGVERMVNLTDFDLTQNTTSDISALAGLTNLTRLDLAQNDISDISALAGLTNLTYLRLKDNQVSDISPLSGMTELTELDLWENQISDISPLAGLTKIEELNLTSNDITDISPLSSLSNLRLLELTKNGITDLSPLLEAGLGEGATIRLWNEPLDANSIEVVIPQLEAAGVKVQF